jgi:hypothetical protein
MISLSSLRTAEQSTCSAGLYALNHNSPLKSYQPHAIPPSVIANLLKQVQKRVGPEPEARLMLFLQRIRHHVLVYRWWFFAQDILVGASMIQDDGFELISGIEAWVKGGPHRTGKSIYGVFISTVEDHAQQVEMVVHFQGPVVEILLGCWAFQIEASILRNGLYTVRQAISSSQSLSGSRVPAARTVLLRNQAFEFFDPVLWGYCIAHQRKGDNLVMIVSISRIRHSLSNENIMFFCSYTFKEV